MHDHQIAGDTSSDINPLATTLPSILATAADVSAPAANTAAVVTYTAVPGKAHVINGIAFSYTATPTGGNIQIQDGASVVFNLDVPAPGTNYFEFQRPLKGSPGNAMTVTLAAPGGTVVGKLTCVGHYTE